MSSSTKIDSRKKDVLIFGKCPTQRLEHAFIECRKNIFNYFYWI